MKKVFWITFTFLAFSFVVKAQERIAFFVLKKKIDSLKQ